MWARIENDTVAELTEVDPKGRFHPSIKWVKATDGAAVGDSFDGKKFAPPEPIEADVDAMLRAAFEVHSDHLFMKWQATGNDADKSAWLERRDEVRAEVIAGYRCLKGVLGDTIRPSKAAPK